MKKLIYFLSLFFLFNSIHSQGVKTFFKSPEGKFFISSDLHIHTVFSDGSVWPDIRVKEAIFDGLDVISLNEHREYQPHNKDIPHSDRNRSYQLVKEFAKK